MSSFTIKGSAVGSSGIPVVGTIKLFAGSVTTAVQVPAVAGNVIISIGIRNTVDQAAARRLEFSYDNVVYHVLKVGEGRDENPLGEPRQVWVRSNSGASVNYEMAINFGDS